MTGRVQLQVGSRVAALPYDPCPADVAGTRALAARLRSRADDLDAGTRPLLSGPPSTWRSASATAAAQALGALVHRVRGLRTSLLGAADALDGWASAVAVLQAEAAELDAAAADNRRRRAALDPPPRELVVDPLVGLDVGRALERDRLDADLRRLHGRAGDLHARYVALARRHADTLDACAPARDPAGAWWRGRGEGTAAGWWDGARDTAQDRAGTGARTAARTVDVTATAASSVSTALGVVAMAVPVTAPVAVPVSLGLAGASLQARVGLAVTAGGSWRAAGTALLGTGLAGVGALGGAHRLGPLLDDMATLAGVDLEVASWLQPPTGQVWTETLTTPDGTRVEVVAHDVAEPWHTGHGVRGAGFAGVATVTVPARHLTGRGPGRGPRSGQRDDEHRVAGRRL